jgi:hypothetical protein
MQYKQNVRIALRADSQVLLNIAIDLIDINEDFGFFVILPISYNNILGIFFKFDPT